MAINDAAKFFEENAKITDRADKVAYNLNSGLLRLTQELHGELQSLRSLIESLQKQLGKH
jgi:hypothetical protein